MTDIQLSEWEARKLGYIVPINWLMKIATNLSAERKLRNIISEVEITNPITGVKYLVNAMWDTGATYTCLSSDFAKRGEFQQRGYYNLIHPFSRVLSGVPNYDISLKLDTEKTAHYVLRAGTFEGSGEFDVIIGLDMFMYGQITMGVKNNVFYFEFVENIYLK